MKQHYSLGTVLKGLYVTNQPFLAENYTRVQVSVRSTDVDRTLMSAETQLSALFPPEGDQKFNAELPWQPIPVHTVPKDQDPLLRGSDQYCPRYAMLREADKDTAEYKQKEKDNAEFFARLQRETGQEVVDLSNIWGVEDILYIENVTPGKSLPSWVQDGDLDKLISLAAYTLQLMYNTPEKHKITAGLWLQEVLSNMQAKKNGTFMNEKLFLYSGHDTTVATMLNALDVYNGIQPGYSSALLVELHSDSGSYFVKLIYRGGPDMDFVELSAPWCKQEKLCTLQEFQDHVTPLIPESWEAVCHIPTTAGSSAASNAAVVLAVILVFVVIAVLVVGASLFMFLRVKKHSYQRLATD